MAKKYCVGLIVATLLLLTAPLTAQFTLSTNFAGGTTGGNGGNTFDLTLLGPPISITRFDVKMSVTTSQIVNVYYKTGTAAGFATTPGAWTLHEAVTTTGLGSATPTPVTLTTPLNLTSGTYGIAIIAQTTALQYNSYTAPHPGYVGTQLRLDPKAQATTGFASTIDLREWNGTVYYTLLGGNGTILNNLANQNDVFEGPVTDEILHNLGTVTFGANQTISSLTFTKSGTVPNASIGTIKLVHDVDTNGQLSVGDTVLGQGTLTGNTITFNSGAGFPINVPTSGGPRLLLAVSSTVNWVLGDTIGFSIVAATDITWSGGTDFTTYPVSGNLRNVTPPALAFGDTGISASNSIPFNTTATAARFQTAYSAAEINRPNGFTITEVMIVGTVVTPAPTFEGMILRLGHGTVAPNLTNGNFELNHNGFTTCFGPVDYQPLTAPLIPPFTSGQMYRFPLTTPFLYNGKDNLVVDWAYDYRSGTGFNISSQAGRNRNYQVGSTFESVTGTSGGDSGNYGIRFVVAPIYTSSLIVNSRQPAGLPDVVAPVVTDKTVARFNLLAVGANQTVSSLKITKTGTIDDADVLTVSAWVDTNGNGAIDTAVDTQLAIQTFIGGSTTFSVPALPAITSGNSVDILIGYTLAASATGKTFGAAILGPADVGVAAGPASVASPTVGPTYRALTKASALPFVEGFETGTLPMSVTRQNLSGSYPTATAVGVAPGTATRTNHSSIMNFVALQNGSTSTSAPTNTPARSGRRFMGTYFTSTSAAAIDFRFDLSAFNANTDNLEFEFYWCDSGWDLLAASTPYNYVFISVDGGTTWLRSVAFMDSNAWGPATAGPWVPVRVGLSPALLAAASNYTNDMVIRIQASDDGITDFFLVDDVKLSVNPAPAISLTRGTVPDFNPSTGAIQFTPITGAVTNFEVAEFDLEWLGTGRSINSLTLTKLGTILDVDVTSVKLWRDNGDGVFNTATDTQMGSAPGFAGGVAVLSGSPLVALDWSVSRRYYITFDVSGAAASGATFGVSINAASDITVAPATTIVGAFPLEGKMSSRLGTVTTLPWTESFDGTLAANVRYLNGPGGTYPSATAVGTTLAGPHTYTTLSRPHVRGTTLSTAPLDGDNQLVMMFSHPNTFASSNSVVAVDCLFDLSAFNPATDPLEFSFWWFNESLDYATTTGGTPAIAQQNVTKVFLSIDGGTTWSSCVLAPFSATLSTVWTQARVDVSAAMLAASLATYTNNMVIRIQAADDLNTDMLMIDRMRLRRVASSLEIESFPTDSLSTTLPGAADRVVGGFAVAAQGANQTVSSITLNLTGTAATADITNVKLWGDTNGNGRLDAGELQIGTTQTTWTAGAVTFTLATPLTVPTATPARVLVTYSVSASAPGGATFGVAVNAAGSITLAGSDPVVSASGVFPLSTSQQRVTTRPSSLPWSEGFDAGLPANMTASYLPGSFPSAITTGGTTTSTTFSGTASVSISGALMPPVYTSTTGGAMFPAASPPNQLVMDFATGTYCVAADFHFDLSAFNAASSRLVFEYAHASIGLDVSGSATATGQDGLFVSVDGGQTWVRSLFKILRPATGQATSPYTINSIDVSAALAAASLNFTNQVVIRIQETENLLLETMVIDDIKLFEAPNLDVERPATNTIQNNANDIITPRIAPAAPANLQYTLRNSGSGQINLFGVTATAGTNVSGVSASAPALTTLNAAASTTTTVSFTPVAPGPFSLTLVVLSDDAVDPTYTINISGIAGPDIDLQRPAGTTIANAGTHTLDPTVYPFGSSTPLTFTISNLNGGSSLTGLTTAASAVGNISTVTAAPPAATTVTAGNSTTFNVTFTPAGAGAFSFTVTVNSNDPIDPAYTITVTGTANTPPAISVTRVGAGGPVSNASTVNVQFNTPLSAQNLAIQVSDTNSQATSLAVNITATLPQGVVLSEWSSAAAGVPYTVNPTSGVFNVPSTNYLVTLTADDGMNTTVFTFTFAVSSNVDATINLPAGSVFAGSAAAGYAASIGPVALGANFTLQLFDGDANPVDVTAVVVVPSAPAGITAPGVSTNNPSGTVISFSGNASGALPGTYTWTFTVHDVFGTPVNVDVAITVLNVAAAHTGGVEAAGGDGSAATPYTATRGLGVTPPPTVTLAAVSDANTAQTLTQVSVVGNPANPSNVFSAAFTGTGNAGLITMAASAKLTVADVGEHTYTVEVSDGVATISVVVRVVVDTSGNTQPTAGRPVGSTFQGTQAAGFTLSLGPNDGLTANALLELTDAESDPIQVVSVTGGGLTGVTAPVAVAVATSLAWTGTIDSSNDPGVYEYTIVFGDNVTTPVTITVSITVLNVAPTHTPVLGVEGDGSTATPYTISHEVGRAAPKEIVTLSDVNSSQTATLAGYTVAPGNPTGGSGFIIAQTGDSIFAVPTAVLKNRDVGVHRFTVTVTDGISNVVFDVTVKVTAPPADKPSSDGCVAAGTGGGIWIMLLAMLLAAPIWMRKRLRG